MKVIRREQLRIGKRQRTNVDPVKLTELKDSILDKGLLHPPVVQWADDGMADLVAGGRRTMAIDAIAKEEILFLCDGTTILPGEFPVISVQDLDELQLQEAELEENIIREDLPWQDRVRALACIHEARTARNPDQTATDTARELQEKGGVVGASGAPVRNLAAIRQTVTEAAIVAKHLADPTVRAARNSAEAFSLIMARETRAFQAELIKRGTIVPISSTLIEVRHGDSLEILPRLDAGRFDLLLGDPPYGIGVDGGGFKSRTVQHHNYADDPETVRKLLQCFVLEGFRVTKARANLFLFIDVDFFGWLKTISAQAGWVPFRTPLTWVKSDSEGLAPWGAHGPRRTCEWIFYATKGQRGLISSPVDVFRENRVGRSEREHGAEKPIELLKQLISCSTLPGDSILDPCCGSGSTLAAARELNRKALGIEKNEEYYNVALVRASGETVEKADDDPSPPATLADL